MMDEKLSFAVGRPMRHADHVRLVDADAQARLADEAETQREHAAWVEAERRGVYRVGKIAAAAMIARFARAFTQPPIRF